MKELEQFNRAIKATIDELLGPDPVATERALSVRVTTEKGAVWLVTTTLVKES
jgi:hypothetical protein